MVDEVQISHRANCDLVLARLARDGDLRLVNGCAGAAIRTDIVTLHRSAAVPGTVIARAWAGAQACVLAIDPLANHDRLLALGRRYGMVTAGTSLLVLERLDQYVRYQVEPPASWPQMQQQYLMALKQQQGAMQNQREAYQSALAMRWHERVAWWQSSDGRAAPPLPPPPVVDRTADAATYGLGGHSPAAAAPAAQVASPQPRVALAVEDSRADNVRGLAPATASPAAMPGQADHGSFAAIGSGGGTSGLFTQRTAPWPPWLGRGSAMDEEMGGSAYGSITIAPFQPDAPYLRELIAADQSIAYATYLRLREGSRFSPSFYLDCANLFLRRDPHLGQRILSNLLALRIEDPGLLRIVAWRLSEAGELNQAIALLRHVLLLRPEEPQSYHDLAIALAQRAEASRRAQDLEEAMGLLMRIVTFAPALPAGQAEAALWNSWTRCPDLDLIALEELNRHIARANRGGFDRPCVIPELDAGLKQNLSCDMRVVMGWDQDETDIDLHVIEPSGEEAFYGHRQTASGGLVSQDNTVGYGPEEYVLRHAPGGVYRVACQYFASHTLTLFGAATVTATVYLDWGRPTERRQMLTLRLEQPGQGVPVGAVEVKAAGERASASDGGEGSNAVTRAQITTLQLGAKRAAVESSLGAPMRVDQDGVTILVYRLNSGDVVRLGFGPGLLWAREQQGGAELDLLR